jgi:hypothetical protein
MNKELKNALKESFEAPAPIRKKEFLRSIQKPSISIFQFVGTQTAYIRKWVWGISALIFAVALIGAEYMERDMLWCISAFMPLLALSVLTESGRSETYGMAEFELSTRFSLKSVVLARLGILGVANLALFCLLVPFAYMNNGANILQTGVYMACPYLLTAFGGLWAVRKIHGKEATYLCAGIAIAVSAGNLFVYQSFPTIYAGQGFIWWIAALILLGIGTTNQCYQMVKQTEELAWNL